PPVLGRIHRYVVLPPNASVRPVLALRPTSSGCCLVVSAKIVAPGTGPPSCVVPLRPEPLLRILLLLFCTLFQASALALGDSAIFKRYLSPSSVGLRVTSPVIGCRSLSRSRTGKMSSMGVPAQSPLPNARGPPSIISPEPLLRTRSLIFSRACGSASRS